MGGRRDCGGGIVIVRSGDCMVRLWAYELGGLEGSMVPVCSINP